VALKVRAGGSEIPGIISFHRRDPHQGQRQHEKASKGRDPSGLEALREGTDEGSQRRPGSPREEAF